MTSGLHALDRHGDRDSTVGMLDFAVNVRGAAPPFVQAAIASTLDDLARYPTTDQTDHTTGIIADLHGRPTDEVMLLAGASDGFELLPKLGAAHAALVQPSFTEPELVLRAAGIPITQVIGRPDTPLAELAADIPDDADLVVVGNPTNPTSVLHAAESIAALRRPGRLVVVDEAFADLTLDPVTGACEPQSLADRRADDVIVMRSVTKTFGLAGLRAGYLLAAPEVIERAAAGRRAWPLSTPALAALAACCGPDGQRFCSEQAELVAIERDHLLARLTEVGVIPCAPPAAPFVLVEISGALAVRESLRDQGIAVRSCANFVGLTDDHLRLAVRPAAQVDRLVTALDRAREEITVGSA
ncbi:Rv2231c family pyridoxal phosphate-dependent protein CobC [Gordonia polyisoprenivorans]|uniref:Rv2231c family pyridoxal phosphate-dependent protein CobC n=1 Tax=Gordonia polyisoprenivorans TaxID=84595 RepID=UPI001AD7D84B|nr:Rv2231c family pyridoxal phosphate-dependent protein CobC [Gordonia polyisoprenivorans]QTI67635.1 threonine-phosphate decarboxylase [Gordonia polyisoprenivorans]